MDDCSDLEMWDDIYSDLPNGAYFAALSEQGYSPDDIADCLDESPPTDPPTEFQPDE